MLRYFRINDPYRLLGLLVILVLIYIPLFIDPPQITFPELRSLVIGEKIHQGNAPYAELIDSNAPLVDWFYGLMDILFGRSILARHILAFSIIFLQSAFLGVVFISKKAFSENTYVPSLIFSILFFFSFDTLALSGELLGSGFLLLALNNLFKEIEFRTQRDETIFNLGLFVSLASLFSFSFIIHLIGISVILGIYARTSLRGYLLLAFGFLLPHFLLMSIYFLRDSLQSMWQYYYLPNLNFSSLHFLTLRSLFTLAIVPLFYLGVSVIMLNREARFTKYQSQLLQCMFFWMVFSFVQILYSKGIRPQSFITLIPSFSFFITHFLLLIRRKRFVEINTWVLLLGVAGVSYLARYDRIDDVQYSELLVHEKDASLPVVGKRILVLEDNPAYFMKNKLATPFFSWKLSKEIFEEPQYYENVIEVNEAFKADPPEVIIDRSNLMEKFFLRIPELKKDYKQTQAGLYERTAPVSSVISN